MNTRILVTSAAALALLAAGAAATIALQDKGGADAEMAKMMAFIQPGPNHKLLEPYAGKWTAKIKMLAPGEPAAESDGTSECKWVMDKRYMIDDTTSTMMGMPFKGMGVTGYDNLKQKFVGTWIDTMGTGVMQLEGSYDASTKTFTFMMELPDMTMTKYVASRMTDKWIDNDHHTSQMFTPGPDGKEAMMMEIHYTRSK